MKALLRLAFAGLVGGGLVNAVQATDLYMMGDTSPPATIDSQNVDWDGFYLGVEKGYYFGTQEFNPNFIAGFNLTVSDQIVLGAEGSAGVNTGSGTTYEAFHVRGRLGVLVSDDALLYGAGGVGMIGGTAVWSAGAGIEFAGAGNLSFRGEGRYVAAIGGGTASGAVHVGAFWHPN